jgi:hypothetical protein
MTTMSQPLRFLLLAYLLLATLFSCAWMISLWSAQPGAPAIAERPSCTGVKAPALTGLTPDRLSVGTADATVYLRGCGLPEQPLVTLNGVPQPAQRVDAETVRVELADTDTAAPGTLHLALAMDVPGSDGGTIAKREIGSRVLRVAPARLDWHYLPSANPWSIGLEVRLLLLVLFTGAFGSCVYALKSFADYRGEDKLYSEWSTYYVIQPFTGAGIAAILYLTIRGGFLGGGGAGLEAANLFGICGVAGLAGAFSDTAFIKLREVFQVLFKPQDDRGGKMVDKLEVLVPSLGPCIVGVPCRIELKSKGGIAPCRWSIAPELPASLALDGATGVIEGTPGAPFGETEFTIEVEDSGSPKRSATAKLKLTVDAAPSSAGTGGSDGDPG